MKRSSALAQQVLKAQKAIRKWPKELRRDLLILDLRQLAEERV